MDISSLTNNINVKKWIMIKLYRFLVEFFIENSWQNYFCFNDNKLIKGMLKQQQNEMDRSYHSDDNRRSLSQQDIRKIQIQKMKMRFRNITNRINEIKKQNTQDINQLNVLLKDSDELQKMANHSLERAKEILSQSKLDKKRVVSPGFHQARHVEEKDYSSLHSTQQMKKAMLKKKKSKNTKKQLNRYHKPTEQTSQSQTQNKRSVQKIIETDFFQEASIAHEQPKPQENKGQKEQKVLRKYSSNSSLLKSQNQTNSTMNSSRSSLKKSRTMHNRKTQTIYPYIVIIVISIVFLVILRG